MKVERTRQICASSPYDTSGRDVVLGGYIAYAHPEEGSGLENVPHRGALYGRGETREIAIENAWAKAAVWLAELGAPVETQAHAGVERPWRARLVYVLPDTHLARACTTCRTYIVPSDAPDERCLICDRPTVLIDGTRWLRVIVRGESPTVLVSTCFEAMRLAAGHLASGAMSVELFDHDPRLAGGSPYRTLRLVVDENHYPAFRPIRGATP